MLLRREGWHVNVKRVHRLYRLEGLQMRSNRHADALWPNCAMIEAMRLDPIRCGQWTGCTMSCSMGAVSGFVPSRIHGAGCARSCASVDRRLPWRSSMRLSRLDGSIACQPRSVSIKGANSPRRRSSIHGPMRTASRWTSAPQGNRPTTRTCKASTLRLECLGRHWFLDLDDACEKVEEWRAEYNEVRPHSAIGDRTPLSLIHPPRQHVEALTRPENFQLKRSNFWDAPTSSRL